MKSYAPDTYLLSPQFQPIAQWWDSMVFLDKKDPSVVLKLYDTLGLAQVKRYYQIQKEIAQKWWTIQEDDLELRVTDPTESEKFSITENEDGILVVLPKVEWVNLWIYGSDIQRTQIMNRVKDLLKKWGLPISWGFEVKPENIMVSHRQWWWERLILNITDVWARVDECIGQYLPD